MIDVICVCRSGGGYDAEWVRKLKDGVSRHLDIPHNFRCLTDLDCGEKLQHDWPGWWSKIELFRPGVIQNPTLYLDLDTVVVGPLKSIADVHTDFSIMRNFWAENMPGSAVMWFSGKRVPTGIYAKFARQADAYIAHHERHRDGPYVGDQAFIWDALDRSVDFLNDHFSGIYSYKFHCKKELPKDARLVCFGGEPRLNNVKADWITENWK